MTILQITTVEIFDQLRQLLRSLNNQQYCQPIATLDGNHLGAHFRHIMEFYQCLTEGVKKKVVNYDNRQRNVLLEQNRDFALEELQKLIGAVSSNGFARSLPLDLQVDYGMDSAEVVAVPTNLQRELSYNIEHAVHHMAIIRIGIREISPSISLPENFGVAVSTVRHHRVKSVS